MRVALAEFEPQRERKQRTLWNFVFQSVDNHRSPIQRNSWLIRDRDDAACGQSISVRMKSCQRASAPGTLCERDVAGRRRAARHVGTQCRNMNMAGRMTAAARRRSRLRDGEIDDIGVEALELHGVHGAPAHRGG